MAKLFPGRKSLDWTAKREMNLFGLGTRLALARRHRRFRQEDFAQATGVSVAQLRRYERNAPGGEKPSLRFMINAALILDVPFGRLVPDEECQYIDPKTGRAAPIPDLPEMDFANRPELPP